MQNMTQPFFQGLRGALKTGSRIVSNNICNLSQLVQNATSFQQSTTRLVGQGTRTTTIRPRITLAIQTTTSEQASNAIRAQQRSFERMWQQQAKLHESQLVAFLKEQETQVKAERQTELQIKQKQLQPSKEYQEKLAAEQRKAQKLAKQPSSITQNQSQPKKTNTSGVKTPQTTVKPSKTGGLGTSSVTNQGVFRRMSYGSMTSNPFGLFGQRRGISTQTEAALRAYADGTATPQQTKYLQTLYQENNSTLPQAQKAPEKISGPIKEISFAGGGGKGISYVGALRALEEQGIMDKITHLSGASAGAITSLFISLGATSSDLERFALMPNSFLSDLPDTEGWQMEELARQQIAEDLGFEQSGTGLGFAIESSLRSIIEIYDLGAVSSGQKLQGFIAVRGKELLKEAARDNPGLFACFKDPNRPTFGEMREAIQKFPNSGLRELNVVMKRESDGALIYANADTMPNVCIYDAVSASAALPGAFPSIRIEHPKGTFERYSDGGQRINTGARSTAYTAHPEQVLVLGFERPKVQASLLQTMKGRILQQRLKTDIDLTHTAEHILAEHQSLGGSRFIAVNPGPLGTLDMSPSKKQALAAIRAGYKSTLLQLEKSLAHDHLHGSELPKPKKSSAPKKDRSLSKMASIPEEYDEETLRFDIIENAELQNGWSCGDIALGTTREKVYEYLDENAANPEVRALMADEIMNAAALSFSMDIPGQLGLPPNLLGNEELETATLIYSMCDAAVGPVVVNINRILLGKGPNEAVAADEILNLEKLTELFTNFSEESFQNAQDRQRFNAAKQIFLASSQAGEGQGHEIYEFNQAKAQFKAVCSSPAIYRQYIDGYYHPQQENWMAFQPEIGGTNIMDVVARMKNAQVVVWQYDPNVPGGFVKSHETEQYSQDEAAQPIIHVLYNGHNHYLALAPNPLFQEQLGIQSQVDVQEQMAAAPPTLSIQEASVSASNGISRPPLTSVIPETSVAQTKVTTNSADPKPKSQALTSTSDESNQQQATATATATTRPIQVSKPYGGFLSGQFQTATPEPKATKKPDKNKTLQESSDTQQKPRGF